MSHPLSGRASSLAAALQRAPAGGGEPSGCCSCQSPTTWQRCTVHFMRNALSTVAKAAQPMVAATLRTIFAQPEREGAQETIARICRLFEQLFPKLVDILAKHSTAVRSGPQMPWSGSTASRSPLRDDRHLPQPSTLLRFVGTILEGPNDEWAVGRRYFSQESMHKLLEPSQEVVKILLWARDCI